MKRCVINIGTNVGNFQGITVNKDFDELELIEILELAEKAYKDQTLFFRGKEYPKVKVYGWANVTDEYLDSKEKFFELAEKVKLSEPQRRILEHLKYERIAIINSHHQSGGDWTWENGGGGSIYKAFWNLIEAVLKPSDYKADIRFLNFIVHK